MILLDGENFAREIKDKWVGREVTVSKTTPAPPIRMRIEDVRISGWGDMDRRIQEKHGRDTKFFVVAGPMQVGGQAEKKPSVDQCLVIPVDGNTAYDVRDNRLVVLTDREVVEFSPGGH